MRAYVVEDNPHTAETLQTMLSLLGFDARVCFTPREAIGAMRAEGVPDVMTLDLNMPEVNGIEVLRFMRRDPLSHDIPIIVISSESQQEVIDRIIRAGANAYLVKPVMLDELDDVLKTLLPAFDGL